MELSPEDYVAVMTAGTLLPLSEIASDPVFMRGFADGELGKPLANYATRYLEGYGEGMIRQPGKVPILP